jgi:Tfp pilus assembly protein PilZ
MENRRKHSRPTLLGKVALSLPQEEGTMDGYTINISRGGIGIYLSRPLEMNTEADLILHFQLEDQEKAEQIGGTVRWIKPIGDLFATGFQFRDLRQEKHPLIFAYLEVAIP